MTETRLSIPPRMALPLNAVRTVLAEQGAEAYLVGGVVRDILLERATADIDIAVGGDALATASLVAERLNGKCVVMDETNGVARVLKDFDGARWQLDFTAFQGSIEEDLARRDFTVNALAVDLARVASPAGAQLIDPSGGSEDLGLRIIRAVRDDVFESDPVRLLRAVRLAAELGFDIESRTESLARRSAPMVSEVPGERVREELLRLLAVPGREALSRLDGLGLLTALIPELAESRAVTQVPMHFWDVFRHTLETVGAVDFLLRRGGWEYGGREFLDIVPWSEDLERHFEEPVSGGSTRRLMLKLAALFHDVAKPATRTLAPDGRTRFFGHGEQGAAVAAGRMEKLRFSSREIKLVELLVRHHLRPTQMSNVGLPSARAIYRYFRDTGDAGIDILFLSLADHLATRGPDITLPGWQEHVATVKHVIDQRVQTGPTAPEKLIDGRDLISVYGLTPGPQFREILEAVREAQAAGEVSSREEALALVRDRLIKK